MESHSRFLYKGIRDFRDSGDFGDRNSFWLEWEPKRQLKDFAVKAKMELKQSRLIIYVQFTELFFMVEQLNGVLGVMVQSAK